VALQTTARPGHRTYPLVDRNAGVHLTHALLTRGVYEVFAYRASVVTATAAAAGLVGALGGAWQERRQALRTCPGVVSR
jgi:hypothetical protein